ncbi:ADP-ribosylation [Xylariaceae sp. FL0662B]|nr:ADP-ribosylation [Xylariaceae sp. FL0662B]
MADADEFSDDELVELSLLRDFEIDELIKAGLLSKDEQQTSPLDREVIFDYDELSLHVIAGPQYPAVSVTWWIDNYTLSIQAVDELRSQLRTICEAATEINNISRWKQREQCAFGIFEPAMVVLDMGNETLKHLKSWRDTLASKTVVKKVRNPIQPTLPFQEKPINSIITTSDVAYHYLGETPQKICSKIPSYYRILHVEEVLRVDLARYKQEQMKVVLSQQSITALRASIPPKMQHSRRKEDFVEYLTKPHVTFHGTSRQYVPSIVRHGFLKPGSRDPGTGEAHEIRCGATYGRGIYSSPNPQFSLCYSGYECHATKANEFFGIKLLVCATLMGRTAQMHREDNWRSESEPYPGADSHVANRGLEYIVFDPRQILPVYVIHIDWGQENAQHFEDLPANPRNFAPAQVAANPRPQDGILWPADRKRAQAAVFARASKWFPYGYGPASGGRFVVEAVGEVDEDEEEYGDYQALRGDEISDSSKLDFWHWVMLGEQMDAAADDEASAEGGRAASADEYTTQRRGYGPLGTKAVAVDQLPTWDEILAPEKEEDGDDDVAAGDEDDDFGLGRLMTSE